MELQGTTSDEGLIGTEVADAIRGMGGHDTLRGLGGDDIIFAGGGHDNLFGDAGNDEIHAGGGQDKLFGGEGNDTLFGGGDDDFLSGGTGEDSLFGDEGNDDFYLGMNVSFGDFIDGGSGTFDRLLLQGNYGSFGAGAMPFTFGANHLTGIESLILLSGDDVRFGDTSGNVYSYNLATVNANIGTNQRLSVTFDNLRADENVVFNGAAESDGSFAIRAHSGSDVITAGAKDDEIYGNGGHDIIRGQAGNDLIYAGGGHDKLYGDDGNDIIYAGGGEDAIYGGAGNDVLVGGDANDLIDGGTGDERLYGDAGNDAIYIGANLSVLDVIDGGDGTDRLILQGSYTGPKTISFQLGQLTGIETIEMLSATDTRYGGDGSAVGYVLVARDFSLGAGQTMIISGEGLRANERLTFVGLEETNGLFLIRGGDGSDDLSGGRGNDEITGGGGADIIRADLGNDTIIYTSIADSNYTTGFDSIRDFRHGDKIDLSRIDAIAGTPGDDAFTFIGLAEFSGAAGELRIYPRGGTADPHWVLQGNVDGIADDNGYTDVVALVYGLGSSPMIVADFVL